MKAKQKFRKACQAVCSAQLPGWQKYYNYGLYRRTEDFVQWLFFEFSDYEVLLVPAYGLQSLAIQFPVAAISLGGRIRNSRGAHYWIGVEDWIEHQYEIVNSLLDQITPTAIEPLTVGGIIEFLDPLKDRDEFGMINFGIAAIVAGDIAKGRVYLEKAMTVYENSGLEWSISTVINLKSWLSCSPTMLISQLRQDASKGASILKLKDL